MTQQAATMQPPASGVKVRMYNPGFGDCLLLAFPAAEGAFYLLIDFGVHHIYAGGAERARRVAEDIARATGRRLDAVAVTHEHTDHLYGFRHARATFEDPEFRIGELWLAWPEDPAHPMAQELKARYGRRVRALAAAVAQLRVVDRGLAEALEAVLAFEPAATSDESAELRFLRAKAERAPRHGDDYLHPSATPHTVAGVEGARFYVLGPPLSVTAIRSLERKSELYVHEMLDADVAFAAAVLGAEPDATPADRELFELTRPFDVHRGIAPDTIAQDPDYAEFFRTYYGFGEGGDEGPSWRRIETDWLAAAEQLALRIDNKTNNTSLVLAVELTETVPHKVLLFVADAQVGSWLSWHELDGEGQLLPDLLQRTVLYKVGHHGSHNATLRQKGLEMMGHPDLVALIPVDEAWANSVPRWAHPNPRLYQRLEEKTHGRILRTDRIPDAPDARPEGWRDAEWEAFGDRVAWDESPDRLWIEITVPG